MTHQRGSPVKAQWLVCDPWIPSRYNDSLLCLPMPGCLGATRFLLPDTCPTMLPAFVARCRKGALQFIVQRWWKWRKGWQRDIKKGLLIKDGWYGLYMLCTTHQSHSKSSNPYNQLLLDPACAWSVVRWSWFHGDVLHGFWKVGAAKPVKLEKCEGNPKVFWKLTGVDLVDHVNHVCFDCDDLHVLAKWSACGRKGILSLQQIETNAVPMQSYMQIALRRICVSIVSLRGLQVFCWTCFMFLTRKPGH